MTDVFVPGFAQVARAWEPVIAHLSADQVEDSRFPSIGAADDFEKTSHALGDLGPARYVGYSMGGRLCVQLALDRPAAVERLVLVSASPGIEDGAARAARRDADERLAQEIERDGADAFLERWIVQPLFASLPRDVARAHRVHDVAVLTHQLRALGQGAQPSSWDRLGELGMPVLLIVGEHDEKYVEIAHRMAERIPNARIEIVAGAGHACHLEQPERIAHVLTS